MPVIVAGNEDEKCKQENSIRSICNHEFFTLAMYKFYLAAGLFNSIENLNIASGLSS